MEVRVMSKEPKTTAEPKVEQLPQEIAQQITAPQVFDPYKRVKDKCYIVGFAPSYRLTPWDDQTAEIWCLNEFYKLTKDIPNAQADRWFEIHSKDSPTKAVPEHVNFLKNCPVPLYMQEHYDDIPPSIRFPHTEIIEWFKGLGFIGHRFFTNTISWMTAFAIMLGFKEIHIYGVDMATKTEYAHQKPSCHYFIGIAEALGIKFYLPEECDLLKCGMLYGFESDNQMRVKMKNRKKELTDRAKQHEANIKKLQQQLEFEKNNACACLGAADNTKYFLDNWIV
jgi:hypothetical protein